MGKVFKRLAGDALNLNFDLFPEPDSTRFVRAFLFDKDGSALTPATVDLTDVGGGRFVETATVMQNIPLMKTRIQVYNDSGYTELDCEYPGDTDCYELDSLLPTQLPNAEGIEANFGPDVNLGAEMEDGGINAEISSDEIQATISAEDEIEAQHEATPEVAASLDSDEIKANIE